MQKNFRKFGYDIEITYAFDTDKNEEFYDCSINGEHVTEIYDEICDENGEIDENLVIEYLQVENLI